MSGNVVIEKEARNITWSLVTKHFISSDAGKHLPAALSSHQRHTALQATSDTLPQRALAAAHTTLPVFQGEPATLQVARYQKLSIGSMNLCYLWKSPSQQLEHTGLLRVFSECCLSCTVKVSAISLKGCKASKRAMHVVRDHN